MLKPSSIDSYRSWLLLLVSLVCLLTVPVCGASAWQLDERYGDVTGRFSKSVNGLSVFAEMLRASDCEVRTYRYLEEATDEADYLVWAPDRLEAPNRDEYRLLHQRYQENQWLSVLFIGRDYEATIAYWERVLDQLEEPQRSNAQRQLEIERSQFRRFRTSGGGFFQTPFYRYRALERWEWAQSVSGSLAAGATGSESEVVLTGRADVESGERPEIDVNVLLEVNGEPFIYELSLRPELPRFEGFGDYPVLYGELHVIVVANGSLLLNLPLVNHQNRIIAQNLIDYLQADSVAILDSGIADISRDREPPTPPNIWEWMSVGPFRWIIPHVLLFSLLYCFCYFPVFGRARRLPPADVSDFGTHIVAVGKLLQRTGNRQHARQQLENYRQKTGEHSRLSSGHRKRRQ